ncbi:unnamed protein product [Boreogadus saida]
MLQMEVDKVTHSDSATGTPDTEDPQEKRRRTESTRQSLLDMHDEILEENSTLQQLAGLTSKTSVQVHGYLSEPPISRNESPLQYWKSNMSRFPALAKAARKLRGLWQGNENEEQSPSLVPEEVHLTCTQFVRYHKDQCVLDLLQTRR